MSDYIATIAAVNEQLPDAPLCAAVQLDELRADEAPTDVDEYGPLRVAYIMSRFPKITETFILFEMQALEAQGVQIEIYPLWRERTAVMHDQAREYLPRAHFRSLMSWRTIVANAKWLSTSPWTYLKILATGLRANWGSARYFFGFLAVFPKAVLFADELSKKSITHIHAHFASHPAAAAFVIHRLTGIPYSFVAHGSDLHRDRHMLSEKVAAASFVVPISHYNQRVIANECGSVASSKLRVIHCGTDTAFFRPLERTDPKQESATRPFQITCVGTLHEVKGQQFLIEACHLLADRGLTIQLHLVGSGPDTARLKKLVTEYGLQEVVEFHGRCTRQDVVRVLQGTDVLAAPSVPTRDGRREGIPVVLMEAMSSGVPVVASDISGIPELVQDHVNGLLVPPGNAAALADALEQLARQPALRVALGRAARATVEQKFDLHKNARRLVEEIQSLRIHKDATALRKSAEVAS